MKQMITARLQKSWDLRAACNFIGGGTGTGLIMASGLGWLLGLDVTWTVLAGLVFVGLGLSMVWLEIGKPWRALHVFFHPQTSWMTREGIIAAPLMACGAGFWWFGWPELLAGAVFFAAGFIYCQARILRAAKAIPAWSHVRTVPLILMTAAAEGTGLFLLIGEPATAMIAAALAMAVAREVAREAYRLALKRDHAPQGTLDWFVRPEVRVLQALRWISMVLLIVGLFGLPEAAIVGGVIAAFTGWGLKAVMVTKAAFNRGARVPRTPVRGRATSRMVQSS
jgi:phenylacetyl-CoA:acceptor oxidoreductase subunit 2